MRSPSASMSSNWPLWMAHQSPTMMKKTSATDSGISKYRISMLMVL